MPSHETVTAPEGAAIADAIVALRRQLEVLEAALAENESWRALIQLERRSDEGRPLHVIDAGAMKARLEAAMALEPSFRAWRRISGVVNELERRAKQGGGPRIDWSAIAARAASTASSDGNASSFRTRFRAKLTSAPRPSIADLLAKAGDLVPRRPVAVLAETAEAPGPAASAAVEPMARHAATVVLEQLRADTVTHAETAPAGASDAAPAPRGIRLADRLADAVAEDPDEIDAVVEIVVAPPDVPAIARPAPQGDQPPPRPARPEMPTDSAARLAVLETEVDALMLSMGRDATVPPMPLARRPTVLVASPGLDGASEALSPSSGKAIVATRSEDEMDSRGPLETINDADAISADEPEAEVVIVARHAASTPAAAEPAGPGPGGRHAHLAERMSRLLRGKVFKGDDYAAYRGRIEEAKVIIVPAGGTPPPAAGDEAASSTDNGAVARFLALLNGRRAT